MAEAEAPPPSPVRSLRAAAAVALAMNENSSTTNDNNTGRMDITVPQLQLKLPELSSSSSDSEGDDQPSRLDGVGASNAVLESGGRASSPPPNCAICLGRCKNKCFTDSCFHQFCFKCLCEWSKVKPECPLCKQTFKSIIHNVKSMSQFERYHVLPPTVQIPHRPIEVPYRTVPFLVDVHGRLVRADRTILSALAGTGAAADNSNDNGNTGSRGIAGSTQNQLLRRSALLDMYRQEHPEYIANSVTLSQQWRRYVYDRKLYAMPVCDITGRFRESNARFYRDNPAQIHRLMPWINRDIVVLLYNTEYNTTTVLDYVKTSLSLVNILSPAFRRRLQPVLGTRTAHFIHELNNFARSPYDMIGYDRAVQYSMQGAEEIVIEFSSSSSSDEDNVNVIDGSGSGRGSSAGTGNGTGNADTSSISERVRSQRNNSGDYRIQSRAASSTSAQPPLVNLLSFTISTTSEGTEAPGVSVVVSGRGTQSTAINLTTHNRTSEVIDLDYPDQDVTMENTGAANVASIGAPTSSSANATTATATVTSATTPAEPAVIADNIELTSSSSDECEFVLERKPPHLRTPEMVSLNSESDSDVVFVEESMPLSVQLRKTAFSSSDEEGAAVAGGGEGAASTAAVSASVSKKSRMALVKHEHEFFNLGASTSTGLRSSGRERGRERRQGLLDETSHRSQRKQQLRRRRSLRSNKDGHPNTRHRKHNDWTSGDSYSVVSSSQSQSEAEGAEEQPKHKSTKVAKSRAVATKQRATRHTRNAIQELANGKRKNYENINKTRKRGKVETHLNEDTSEEEEDDGLNLKVLKTRLAAEKEQWYTGRSERRNTSATYSTQLGEIEEAPSTSRVQVEHDDSRSSCSNCNDSDNWQDPTINKATKQLNVVEEGTTAANDREEQHSRRKQSREEQQTNVMGCEADEYTLSYVAQDADNTEATADVRSVSRASARSITTHTSSTDSSVSSAVSSTSSCSSSTSSTSTASSHFTTSAGEESNSSLFNLEMAIEDILGTSRQPPTEPWSTSVTPNTNSSTAAVPQPASTTKQSAAPALAEQELDVQDITAAAITLANFRNNDSAELLGLEMPVSSNEDGDECGSTDPDGSNDNIDTEYNKL